MTEIKVQDLERIQKEVLRFKQENLQLREQIQKLTTTSQTFLQSLFAGNEKAEIARLQEEESELKKSLQVHQEKNEALREQCQRANVSESIATQIATLDALFKTKKRELTRMKELNTTTLSDLEEEVELARGLCESLEGGRASLSRDKEALESTSLSLQAARQSLDARIRDLESVNQQLRADLGVKAADSSGSLDLAFQLREATDRLSQLTAAHSDLCGRFDAEEAVLAEREQQRRIECEALDERQQAQAAQVEDELRSLRKELQSLKSRSPADETVEIDVDALVQENTDLRAKIGNLEQRKAELDALVAEHQLDCLFLGNWLKREQQGHADAEAVFQSLIQRACAAREELRQSLA